MSEIIGKTIGKFKIVAELGGGGMAEVYKAYQASLKRDVAIKIIHRFLTKDDQFITRFQREAQSVAALRHPNIVQVFDFEVGGKQPYMVMEFIDGPTLSHQMAEKRAKGELWSVPEVTKIISDVGSALAYAHKKEMIHRDVKPANVMCSPNGRYILTDFGLAKLLDGPSFTATGTVMGTPAYMSPEQCRGQAGDARTDIYSLGIMLYELAVGKLPFQSDSQVGFFLKHINEAPSPPKTLNKKLPSWLAAIILKALAKNESDRYQTVNDMLSDLAAKRAPAIILPTIIESPLPKTVVVAPDLSAAQDFDESQLKAEEAAGRPESKSKRSRFGRLSMPKVSLPKVKTSKLSLKGLREKAESAAAAIEEQQDKISSRSLEAAEKVRKGLQSKLEDAAGLAAAAQRGRYTILVLQTEGPLSPSPADPVTDKLATIMQQHGGKISAFTGQGLVVLFEMEGSSKHAPRQAIGAGLAMMAETRKVGSPLEKIKVRVGIHAGILATNEPGEDEDFEITAAITEAASFNQVMVSHAAYSKVRWRFQFDKQPSIREPGTDTPVQIYLVMSDAAISS